MSPTDRVLPSEAPRWTAETEAVVYGAVSLGPEDLELASARRELTRDVLAALADAGLLVPSKGETREEWRYNAKLHNDMRRRIQHVATHAAAETRTLSWVSDELIDTLGDPQAWSDVTEQEG